MKASGPATPMEGGGGWHLPATPGQSLDARRALFLKRPKDGDGLSLAERIARSVETAEKVERELKAKQAMLKLPRPLKRFGCKLAVMLMQHTGVPGKRRLQRKLVVMSDTLKWTAFPTWLETCLGLEVGAAKTKVLQYFNHSGVAHRIERMADYKDWIDEMWMVHPPELHVYDVEGLVQDAEDRMSLVQDIFERQDTDNSGTISVGELREMLLQLDISSELSISRDELAAFASWNFAKADLDDSGQLNFDEFVRYYNSMQDFLRDKLTHEARHTQASLRFREMTCEARSYRRTLRDVLSTCGGKLTLECSGSGTASFEVAVSLPPACVSKANCDKWVQAQTLLTDKIDWIEDYEDNCGCLMSAPLWVEFAPGCELDDFYHVRLPHCFHEDVEHPVDPDDVVVAYTAYNRAASRESYGKEGWVEVSPDNYRLLPAVDGRLPVVEVRMAEGGVVAVFARRGRPVKQRVQLFGYLPAKIIPLETEVMRMYVCPHLPHEVEAIRHREMAMRGKVILGGKSPVLCASLDAVVEIRMGEDEAHQTTWEGETVSLDYQFDPEAFRQSVSASSATIALKSKGAHKLQEKSGRPASPEKSKKPSTAEGSSRAAPSAAPTFDPLDAVGNALSTAAAATVDLASAAVGAVVEGAEAVVDAVGADVAKAMDERADKLKLAKRKRAERAAVASGGGGQMVVKRSSVVDVEGSEDEDEDEAAEASASLSVSEKHVEKTFTGDLPMEVSVRDGVGSGFGEHAASDRRLARRVGNDDAANARYHASRCHMHHFNLVVTIHKFPSPGPPRRLSLYSRTNTNMVIKYEAPVFWGGCAIVQYELVYREYVQKGLGMRGDGDGLAVKEWSKPIFLRATDQMGTAFGTFHRVEVRVRAYNVGSATPGEWSQTLLIFSEKEEEAALVMEKSARQRLAKRRTAKMIEEASGTAHEGGIAVVEQEGLDGFAGKKHTMVRSMEGWSAFARVVGQHYLSMGVHRGVQGKLFDLTPQAVEELTLGNEKSQVLFDCGWPLLSLAGAGVWMMHTLAHHTKNSGEWIAIMNEIEGLVSMAAHAAMTLEEPTETTIRHSRAILMALLKAYETLRQCEDDGFITKQLSQKYDKKLKKVLRGDWEQQISLLKMEISTNCMGLLIYARTARAKAGCVRLTLDRAMTSDKRAMHRALHPDAEEDGHEKLHAEADKILAKKYELGRQKSSPRAASGAAWRQEGQASPTLSGRYSDSSLPTWLTAVDEQDDGIDEEDLKAAVRRSGGDYERERRWADGKAKIVRTQKALATLTQLADIQEADEAGTPDGLAQTMLQKLSQSSRSLHREAAAQAEAASEAAQETAEADAADAAVSKLQKLHAYRSSRSAHDANSAKEDGVATPAKPLTPSGSGSPKPRLSRRLSSRASSSSLADVPEEPAAAEVTPRSTPFGPLPDASEEEQLGYALLGPLDAELPPAQRMPLRINLTDVTARGLVYTRKNARVAAKHGKSTEFFVAFELPSLHGQPRGSTLAVRASANPEWQHQIVTLPLPVERGEGRLAPPLLLRVILCEQHGHGTGATPIAVAEVLIDPRAPVVIGPLPLNGNQFSQALLAFTVAGEW